MLEARRKRGKAAEKFAMAWDLKRLIGADVSNPGQRIVDVSDRPGYGYDFESIDNDGKTKRFVEVKSVLKRDDLYRFFMSSHEQKTATSADKRDRYYFYLVKFNNESLPTEVHCVRANELWGQANLATDGYVVSVPLPD